VLLGFGGEAEVLKPVEFREEMRSTTMSILKLLRNEIINSYSEYFKQRPYKAWFGNSNGGKIEGFLNGCDASYYENIIYNSKTF